MDQATLTAPADLAVLDWPADEVLVGVTFGGAVHRSADGGKTWSLTGQLPGHVEAFAAESNGWFAATERGIVTSNDQGRQWIQLV